MSMVNVLYFARLREVFGLSMESVPLGQMTTVGELINLLGKRGDPWSTELGSGKPYRVAVNQEMAGMDQALHAGDEVAIFPPVTGG